MAEELCCWVCCDGPDRAELLPMGCACRGSAGLAHVACLVLAAEHNVNSWTSCPTCKQEYTGRVDVLLAEARWELVRHRPEEDAERLFVANNLAVTRKESAGDNAGALQLMEEVLSVRRRTLGDEHPHTLDSIANLALQHAEMGHYDAALPLSEEALGAMRRTLGDEHEHTLVSMAALGALHLHMGQFRAAWPLCVESLDARRRMLGNCHLETINSIHLLGRCFVGLGDWGAGLALLEEAQSTATRVLGEGHPSTQHFASTLAKEKSRGDGAEGAASATNSPESHPLQPSP
ncbi:hypothetical protein AB1Y20_009773 [Prymnesium parvum]|uniref:RING-CH-type domain-containing protein n=1 Tax=Prymnesium parvum TaxID=97485 RepID=A0AB34K2Z0_PRYPA